MGTRDQGKEDRLAVVRAPLHHGSALAADPVAAVSPDLAIPTDPTQPALEPLRVHEVLDDAELAAILQLPFDDLIPATGYRMEAIVMRRNLIVASTVLALGLELAGPAWADNPPGPPGPPSQSCQIRYDSNAVRM